MCLFFRYFLIIAVVTHGDGFVPSAKIPFSSALQAQVTEIADTHEEEAIGMNSTESKMFNITRTWKGGIEDMEVSLILPKNNAVKGTVFFMHGFSQYPEAYRRSLKTMVEDLKVAVVAVETGLTSPQVLQDIFHNPEGLKAILKANYFLQRAVAMDTTQCVEMAKNGEYPFEELKGKPMGLYGHSMGGGLTFYVSSQTEIDYVGGLAPEPGVKDFRPEAGLKIRPPANSIMVAGSWDLIARPSKVTEVFKMAKETNVTKSLYTEIARGLHTGFEDRLVLFSKPLFEYGLFFVYFQFLSLIELGLLTFLRRVISEDQLYLGRSMMTYLFDSMLKGNQISESDLKLYLQSDTNLKKKWLDDVTYKS